MLSLSTFMHSIHSSKQLSHTVQLPGRNYPADSVVFSNAKGGPDSLYQDDSTAALAINPPVTSLSSDSTSFKKPHAIYDGGYEDAKIQGVRLRIANGGAGQTGLIRAWADEFIQYMVSEGMPPFEVVVYTCVKS